MIQDILAEKKLNIRKLSIKTGIPYTTLYEYSSGKRDFRQMSLMSFQSIAEALDISMDELWSRWDTPVKTKTDGNFVLEKGTEVYYRLYRRKRDYIMYVKHGMEWIKIQKKYPPKFPEEFYPGYYNITANMAYYNADLQERLKGK